MGDFDFIDRSPVMLAIDSALEEADKKLPKRSYLGMSSIGEPCERKLWYGLRYKRNIEARGIRCIQDGHAGELVMAERLRMVRLTITDQQIRFSDYDNRFAGHPDGIIIGELLHNKKHIWEHKQVNEKKFNEFKKTRDLEQWDETYYAQAQMYMRYSGLDRHYLTVSTPGGRDYEDCRTRYADRKAEALRDKARRILDATSEPRRLSENKAFYLCKWCEHRERCHDR